MKNMSNKRNNLDPNSTSFDSAYFSESEDEDMESAIENFDESQKSSLVKTRPSATVNSVVMNHVIKNPSERLNFIKKDCSVLKRLKSKLKNVVVQAAEVDGELAHENKTHMTVSHSATRA